MSTRALTPSGIFTRILHLPLLMYGVLFIAFGFTMYIVGVLLGVPRILLGLNRELLALNTWLVWHSGMPVVAGIFLGAVDLFLLLPGKQRMRNVGVRDASAARITVALTAFNDEAAIAPAVADFRSHARVDKVIVVSNNSTDATFQRAAAAGAITVNEERQGYGYCFARCLSEALRFAENELIVLCEGDRTFRASDIDKLLAYSPHADIVNGTRTVELLREPGTQLSTFMYYGNLFVAKLLEAKHVGRSTLTDVGTTYKLCRRSAVERLLPLLRPDVVNLEFNAYFLDTAIAEGLAIVECPISFHPRVGVSKGGNVSNWRALQVGLRMISGIVFGWRGTATAK